MLDILIWFVLLAASILVLVKSADYFTDYSEKLGLVLGVPVFIIGVTVVALGTSLPELASSTVATIHGQSEFVAGNVVGSNIANILLVVGLAVIASKLIKSKENLMRFDIPALLVTTGILIYTLFDGVFSRLEGIICIILYVIYIVYTMTQESAHSTKKRPKFRWQLPVMIILGAVGIYFGSNWTVTCVIKLTELLGLSNTSKISITIVALGTSLPELSVSIIAAMKKQYDISIGNIIGSNIFNSLMVMGIPAAFIMPLEISNTVMAIGVPFMTVATVLYVIDGMDNKFTWKWGSLYLILYVAFILKVIGVF